MRQIVVYGAGGFGREVRGMLEMRPDLYTFAGFLDDFKEVSDKAVGEWNEVVMAIADPVVRQRLIENWKNQKTNFPILIAGDVLLHPSIKVNMGSIICSGVRMTVDTEIGKFVIINLNTTIGHDTVISDFCSLMPSVNISGSVKIGKGTFIGTGATVLQGVSIGERVVVGAGSLVNKDIPSDCVVVGIPARITKSNSR